MQDPDFEDFMLDGGFDLLFLDNKDEIKCPSCNRIIKSSGRVEWIDRKRGVFKCPDCDERLVA